MKHRWEIVFLSRHPKGPKLGIAEVARTVKCSKKTVKNWLDCYQRTGDVEEISRCGPPRVTSHAEDLKIIKIAVEDPEVTSDAISKRLKRRGTVISSRSVRRRLNEAGLKYTAPMCKPLLSDSHQRNRLHWSKSHRHMDWNRVIFTDETTILLDRPPSRVWQRRGARIPVWTVKHPLKLHVWGCFSSEGFGDIFMFTQNLNSDLICKIYEMALLPSAQNWFEDWALQEDNDPKHMAKKSQKWKAEHNVHRIPWPAQSPDLNPIENVWKVLKDQLRQYRPRTLERMKRCVSEIWKQFPIGYAKNLVNSMPDRLEACISNNGGFTPY